MLRLACQQNEHFRISDVEFKRNGTSYTIDTIRTLKKQFDDIEFYWLIGADQAAQFEEWKDWQQLLKEAHFVVADRQQQLDLLKKDYGMIRLSMEPVDVSSSQIRTGFRLNLMPERTSVLPRSRTVSAGPDPAADGSGALCPFLQRRQTLPGACQSPSSR